MNRGKYEFPSEEEKQAWVKMVSWAIEGQLEGRVDEWDLSHLDITPYLLDKCVEACGWDWDFRCREREDCWNYYYHSDYPNHTLCIYADSSTFKLTLEVYEKEEE